MHQYKNVYADDTSIVDNPVVERGKHIVDYRNSFTAAKWEHKQQPSYDGISQISDNELSLWIFSLVSKRQQRSKVNSFHIHSQNNKKPCKVITIYTIGGSVHGIKKFNGAYCLQINADSQHYENKTGFSLPFHTELL